MQFSPYYFKHKDIFNFDTNSIINEINNQKYKYFYTLIYSYETSLDSNSSILNNIDIESVKKFANKNKYYYLFLGLINNSIPTKMQAHFCSGFRKDDYKTIGNISKYRSLKYFKHANNKLSFLSLLCIYDKFNKKNKVKYYLNKYKLKNSIYAFYNDLNKGDYIFKKYIADYCYKCNKFWNLKCKKKYHNYHSYLDCISTKYNYNKKCLINFYDYFKYFIKIILIF